MKNKLRFITTVNFFELLDFENKLLYRRETVHTITKHTHTNHTSTTFNRFENKWINGEINNRWSNAIFVDILEYEE